MSVKILVADKLPNEAIDRLEDLHCSVVYDAGLKNQELLEALREEQPQILIVRSTQVTADMIEANPYLGLIIRAGAGYNTIDVKTASDRSVYVANCPGKNAIAVAELAFGLILSLDRRIPDNVIELRQGNWNKKEYSKAEGIYGKTLGVIGTGKIGQEVIYRALCFGMNVIAWSRSLTEEKAAKMGVESCNTARDVASRADIVTVHLALTEETRGFIDSKFFGSMKEGAFFINTSRAEVVDEEAMLDAVEKNHIKAGLDVFTGEPEGKTGGFTNPLKDQINLYGTHHIGASTQQAQLAVANEAVDIVKKFLNTKQVKNCVNLLEQTPAKYVVSVHHRNRVGVLANVLRIIRDTGINVERMDNTIFQGGEGACANIQIDDELTEKSMQELENASEDVYSVTINEIER
jgi:D-3-phosphoglycerate dehydrogenase